MSVGQPHRKRRPEIEEQALRLLPRRVNLDPPAASGGDQPADQTVPRERVDQLTALVGGLRLDPNRLAHSFLLVAGRFARR